MFSVIYGRGRAWTDPNNAALPLNYATTLHVTHSINGGELFERVIDDEFKLTEKSCTMFVKQICEGVAFIHSQNILHLDLKPENILCLTKTGNRIKIIDFGLARHYDPLKKLQVLFGSAEFAAPEVVNFDPIGYYTDMWSVGVICYVLYVSRVLLCVCVVVIISIVWPGQFRVE